MRLIAVVLNIAVLVSFVAPLLTRTDWSGMTAGRWAFVAVVVACPVVNLIVLRDTVVAWVLRLAQKRAEEGGGAWR